jgi:hypothetical protein
MKPSSDCVTGRLNLYTSLGVVLLVNIIGNVAELALALTSSCDFLDVIRRNDACGDEPTLRHVRSLNTALLTLTLPVIAADWLSKCWYIVRLRYCVPGGPLYRWMSNGGNTGHWVAGATRSFFLETAAAVRTARALAMMVQLPSAGVALAMLHPALEEYRLYRAHANGAPRDPILAIPEVCVQNIDSFACHSHLWWRPASQSAWTLMLMMFISVLCVPAIAWSPVSEQAARHFNDASLLRMIRLPWLLTPVIVVLVCDTLISGWLLQTEGGLDSYVTVRQVRLAVILVAAAYGLGLFVWSRLLQDSTAVVRQSLAHAWHWLLHWRAGHRGRRVHPAAADRSLRMPRRRFGISARDNNNHDTKSGLTTPRGSSLSFECSPKEVPPQPPLFTRTTSNPPKERHLPNVHFMTSSAEAPIVFPAHRSDGLDVSGCALEVEWNEDDESTRSHPLFPHQEKAARVIESQTGIPALPPGLRSNLPDTYDLSCIELPGALEFTDPQEQLERHQQAADAADDVVENGIVSGSRENSGGIHEASEAGTEDVLRASESVNARWQEHAAKAQIGLETSAYHQHLVALYAAIYMFASADASSVTAFVLLYCARAFTLLLLLFLRQDRQCDMQDLRVQGAGLGLVIHAKRLAKAIDVHLQGIPLSLTHDFKIPTYKATVLRMQRTMAVSYRWQPEDGERHLTDKVSLNMNDFQLRSLAKAIRDSNCQYVWIDKIAVPQHRGDLQKKLLSRMLAVYCSAYETLALRTAEEEQQERYHSRSWTAQVSEPIPIRFTSPPSQCWAFLTFNSRTTLFNYLTTAPATGCSPF